MELNMEIKTLVGLLFGANCYIVKLIDCALVIDPCVTYQEIKKEVGDLEIKAILLTHGHVDHFNCLHEIKEQVNCPIYCHKNAKEKIEDPNKNYSRNINKFPISHQYSNEDYLFVHQGYIEICGHKLKVLETPGHSNCSICFIIEDSMFTGDTLFYKSIGRTDLYTSSDLDMHESLKKIRALKEDYTVYPGHDRATSLSFEFKNNRHLKD
jgi:glyoxylase-like metal-dependent hydrolase (beta-lactamase superfamily II)